MEQMSEIFPWNKNLETGIKEIDDQHFKLVQLLNKLTAQLVNFSDISSKNDVFRELTNYAVYHFKSEEAIWNKYFAEDDIERVEHAKIHNSFLEAVLELKDKENNLSNEVVIEEVIKFLTHWLALHILESDKKNAKIVLALRSGLSLEEAKKQADAEMNSAVSVLIETILGMYDKLSSHTLNLMKEISLRKKMEQEKALLQEQLLKAGKLEAITILASGISHEINNPLTLIFGNLKKLKRVCTEQNGSEEMLALIEKQEDASKRAAQIIRKLKQVTEPGSETYERVNFEDILKTIVNLYIDEETCPTIKIETSLNSVNKFLIGNTHNLTQIIHILISNSIDACENRKNSIIKITTSDKNDEIIFSVIDNGIGIKNENLPKVLSPFFTTKPPGKGTGLGLCIANSLVEAIGGQLNINSEEDKGTNITISFPSNYAINS